jgi:serine/threonine protein kinase
MKVLKKAELRKRKQVEHIKSERRILEKVNDPFVVGLHCAFQTEDKLCFVLDYWPGGELFFYIQHFQSFPEKIARFYASNILLGLEVLHNNDIVYRDLKPENVLVGKDGYAKITDFGLSKENIQGNQQATSFWGTPEYLAPETLLRKGTGKSADWWSFGAIVYEMLTGLPPFYDKNRQELYNNIKNMEIDFRNDKDLEEKGVSDEAKDFLAKILVKDPKARLGGGETDAEEIKNHPWFSDKYLDWDAIVSKTEKSPYVPNLQNDDDVDHFDEQFTKMDPHGSYNTKGIQKRLSEDQWSDFDLDVDEESDDSF